MKFTVSLIWIFLSVSVFSNEWQAVNDGQSIKSQDYLINRIPQFDKRYPSFLLALDLLQDRKTKVLVETGTARDGWNNFFGDGGSTIIFGHWAAEHQAKLHSVDLSLPAIRVAAEAVQAWSENIQLTCNDSVEFLRNFDKPIDFLYLDSFDFNLKNPTPSQEHHLNEIIAAYPKLHAQSVVMIDDCDLPFGGKGKLVIEFLRQHGWRALYEGYQVILIQN